jgi:SMC interacting uncharacterized protein involved in chromosome segregation
LQNVTREEFKELANDIKGDIKNLTKNVNDLLLEIHKNYSEHRETITEFRVQCDHISKESASQLTRIKEIEIQLNVLIKSKVESEAQLTLIKNAFKIGANIKGFVKFLIYAILIATASEGFGDFFHWIKLILKHSTNN